MSPRTAVLTVLACGAFALVLFRPVRDVDMFWQVRTGELMLETGRLVTADGRPLRPQDVPADTAVGIFPEGHLDAGDGPAFAVRLDPERFSRPPSGGHLDGLVVYSLLCNLDDLKHGKAALQDNFEYLQRQLVAGAERHSLGAPGRIGAKALAQLDKVS